MSSTKIKEAWVFVVWGNPKYLVGAIVGAYSFKQQKTKKHIVLIHSYTQSDVEPFKKLFDKIIKVPVTEINVVAPRTEKQAEYYGGYFSRTSITKWNCLDLTEYQKVCFVDSDIIANKPEIDTIFELNTPAGNFDNYFSNKWVKNGIPSFYGTFYHGKIMDSKAIKSALEIGSTVVGASMVLLKPDGSFNKMVEWASKSPNGYGHLKCYSGTDEQVITEWMLHQGQQWKHASSIYQVTPWHMKAVSEINNDLKNAYGIHYMHDKPWEDGRGQGWEDTKIWWRIFHSMPQIMKTKLSKYIDPTVLKKNST
jgi:hypothetical protein